MSSFHPIQTSRDLVPRILRILLIGLVIGILASLGALTMVKIIGSISHWLVVMKNTYPGSISVILTISIPVIGGLIVGHLIEYISESRPHNPADVILAVQSNLKLTSLKLKDGVLNFIVAIISLASGASLGQYGPIVNMGATLAANLTKIARIEPTVLIGCGVAAAISSAFSAPIAGVIFAHEVILRHYSLRAFAPITIASSVGFYLSKFVFYSEPLFQIEFIQILFLGEFIGFTVIGIFAGILAVMFLRFTSYLRSLSAKVPVKQKFKPAIAGFIIGIVALQIPEILGVGATVLRQTLYVPPTSVLDLSILLIAKFSAAALCLAFGFAGGVFSPALMIGVLFGTIFGMGIEQLFPYSNIAIYAVCGMAAVTSPIIGAPLTTILIIFELTQSYELTTAVMISVVFSNVVASRLYGRSLFDFQLESRGYDLSYGRDPLILSTEPIGPIARQNYTQMPPKTTIADAIQLLSENDSNQAFVLDKNDKLIGSLMLVDLVKHIEHGGNLITEFDSLIDPHCLRFTADTSVWDGMQDILGFVGERIPIVDQDNTVVGVIYEADLIEVYMKTTKALRNEETANA